MCICEGCGNACVCRYLDTDSKLYCATCWEVQYDHAPAEGAMKLINNLKKTRSELCSNCENACSERWLGTDYYYSDSYCPACWEECGQEGYDCEGCGKSCVDRYLDTDHRLYCAMCWEAYHGAPPPRHAIEGAGPATAEELLKKSLSELKDRCREAGVAVSGTKVKLIENLLNGPKGGAKKPDEANPKKKAKSAVCAACGNNCISPLIQKLYCAACWKAEGAVNDTGPADAGPAVPEQGHEAEVDESRPTVPLGADGRFRLIPNAMSVLGFHVAVNVFSSSLHKTLSQDPVFIHNTQARLCVCMGPYLKGLLV
jgi:hypothetical protein